MNGILLYEEDTILSIHSLMGIWVVSSFELIIKLGSMFVFKFLCRHKLLFLLGEQVGMDWLDHTRGICLTL